MDPDDDDRGAGVWVIVVAAGSGQRFGAAKQYQPLGDRRVMDWALDGARSVADGLVLVVTEGAPTEVGVDRTVTGGATRSDSVRAGLEAVPDTAEVVVVHDAARPLAGDDLFAEVVAAVRSGADAAIPSVPVVDTVRRRDGGLVAREDLVAVQTPQAFAAGALRAAHADSQEASDDATLVDRAGGHVVLIEGEVRNLKITEPDDLVVARALLEVGR